VHPDTSNFFPTQQLDKGSIVSAISHIKETARATGKQIISNWIPSAIPADTQGVITEQTIVYSYADIAVRRAVFAGYDPEEIARLLSAATVEGTCLDWIVRSADEVHHTILQSAGYHHLATYERLAVSPLPDLAKVNPAMLARPDECAFIMDLLYHDFDPRLDHLPSHTHMLEMITNGHVIVHRSNGNITGYFCCPVNGKSAHLNYWRSHDPDPLAGSMLITQAYACMRQAGAIKAYAWVNVKNTRVAKIHRRLGMTPEGVHDYIYQKSTLSGASDA